VQGEGTITEEIIIFVNKLMISDRFLYNILRYREYIRLRQAM